MDLAAFRLAFPEFENATDALIEGKLAEAAISVSSEVYGEQYDTAHGYLTAHLLSASPRGRALARLENDKEATTYLRAFEAIRLQVAGGWHRVA